MAKRERSEVVGRRQTPSKPQAKRKRYRAPQFVVYGDVAKLTEGGVSGSADHGANMMLV